MDNTSESAKEKPARKRTSPPLWVRFVHYVIRKARKRKADKEPEAPADKASRRTANATIAIAFFTLVLVVVSYFQLKEIHEGGKDTHDLAVAAGKQATWTQNLAANMQTQADRTRDLADRMKDQAHKTQGLVDQATIQAKEATVAANAAKSAAETANKALHISERAYIVVGLPGLDTTTKYITLPILNTGHMPSGKVSGIIHEVTADGIDPTATVPVRVKPTEAHWKHYELASIPTTGQTMNFNVPVPALNVGNLNSGDEQIIVVGIITYSDGFPDDPDQQWPFCEGSAMLPMSKNLQWVVCDPDLYLPEAIQEDHYPNNQYPN